MAFILGFDHLCLLGCPALHHRDYRRIPGTMFHRMIDMPSYFVGRSTPRDGPGRVARIDSIFQMERGPFYKLAVEYGLDDFKYSALPIP